MREGYRRREGGFKYDDSFGNRCTRRMVYIEVEDGYDFKQVSAAIKADDYFAHDETHVMRVECVDNLLDMGHGVNLVRKVYRARLRTS